MDLVDRPVQCCQMHLVVLVVQIVLQDPVALEDRLVPMVLVIQQSLMVQEDQGLPVVPEIQKLLLVLLVLDHHAVPGFLQVLWVQ